MSEIKAVYEIERVGPTTNLYHLRRSDTDIMYSTTETANMQNALKRLEIDGFRISGAMKEDGDHSYIYYTKVIPDPPVPMTVGELRQFLALLPSKMPVFLYMERLASGGATPVTVAVVDDKKRVIVKTGRSK